ncbi:hypothetical protein HR45_02800 [Shewanella mangrovi]|uniref:Probable lipopolysaccharide assembly protein A n=1 Tax=Shewanella mangrovi TaxID=1515746 RepID=A0A094LT88_9GAMM|nr:lipopolysaccharide assembly protein LapA domain-containing protein [Shewanella mangrovi]KFZ38393.1 hypothetical protein HR45_02800 [Shewanella mangrovi]
MKSFVVTVIVALLFIIALIFGARNEQLVTINYFVVEGEYRLPLVLAVVFFAGFVCCWLVAFFYILRLKLSLKRARRRLMTLEAAQQESDS